MLATHSECFYSHLGGHFCHLSPVLRYTSLSFPAPQLLVAFSLGLLALCSLLLGMLSCHGLGVGTLHHLTFAPRMICWLCESHSQSTLRVSGGLRLALLSSSFCLGDELALLSNFLTGSGKEEFKI